MNRDQVFSDVDAKHARRTEAVRRTIVRSPDVLSARQQLRDGILTLPGVSGDPRTIEDIMSFVDQFVQKKEELDRRREGTL
jgi:hypothetical protein